MASLGTLKGSVSWRGSCSNVSADSVLLTRIYVPGSRSLHAAVHNEVSICILCKLTDSLQYVGVLLWPARHWITVTVHQVGVVTDSRIVAAWSALEAC